MYMCVCALLWLLWLPQESGQEETDAGGREEERVKVVPSWISEYRSDHTHIILVM